MSTTIFGQGNRTRTCDFFIPSEALYQTELYPDCFLAGKVGVEPTVHAFKVRCLTTWLLPNNFGEGTESRTLACGFGDRRATITLYQHIGGMGEIRTHDFMDLQSTPLGHSSTIPILFSHTQ